MCNIYVNCPPHKTSSKVRFLFVMMKLIIRKSINYNCHGRETIIQSYSPLNSDCHP